MLQEIEKVTLPHYNEQEQMTSLYAKITVTKENDIEMNYVEQGLNVVMFGKFQQFGIFFTDEYYISVYDYINS